VTLIIRYLGGTGLALWALVMALGPDPGFSAPWPWLALFWALQIGVGLTILQSTLYLLSRADKSGRIPLWLLVLVSGVSGVVALAPLYWLIGEGLMQQVLGFTATIDDVDDLISPQQAFGLTALAEEFGEIAGPVITAWVLISWPRLQGLLPPLVERAKVSGTERQTPKPDSPNVSEATVHGKWSAALPSELGDDVIAVKSELQYLRVWTSRGCALVLGSLQEVEDSEGLAGMRVHRSWWVHARHVRSVRRRGDGAVCELSDGREVPVSRRRKADALARFGDGARYDGAPAASSTPPVRPNQNTRRNPT
jgi:DNA-binding LytR/AlgR family response regulator